MLFSSSSPPSQVPATSLPGSEAWPAKLLPLKSNLCSGILVDLLFQRLCHLCHFPCLSYILLSYYKNCGEVHIMSHGILNICGFMFVHAVMQPPPPSISKTPVLLKTNIDIAVPHCPHLQAKITLLSGPMNLPTRDTKVLLFFVSASRSF